ncbi:MAG TPA: Gfo/Idh/MocA family oxidoreductase [Spirochaetia bacterium]|nr:Gfo/Idh/MocA family oxidoreductase [Spirochaetia bacterium]
MAKPVRFGIIGSGFIALTHAEALKSIPDAQLEAIAGGRNAAGLASEYGVRMEAKVEDLMEAGDIDAVVICSPHYVHAEQTLSCLRNGKHVLVEKPMAVSVSECKAMIGEAQKSNRKLMVAHFQRYREPNARAKQAIQAGRVGRVRIVQQRLLEPPNDKPWQLDPRSSGFLLGYGVHCTDLLRWWLDSEIERVAGFCHRFRGNPTEDGAQAVFWFASGASASLTATDSLPGGKAGGSPGAAGLVTLIIGERASLRIDSYGQALLESGDRKEVLGSLPAWSSLTSPERIKAYRRQDEDFVRCILQDSDPPISGIEGMRNVAAALSVYESCERGAIVQLPRDL